MKTLFKKEYKLSRADAFTIASMAQFCIEPYINTEGEIEKKILNSFIFKEGVYTDGFMEKVLNLLANIKHTINGKQSDMTKIINTGNIESEKKMAQHFYDNYNSQLRNIQQIESILTTETEEEEESE